MNNAGKVTEGAGSSGKHGETAMNVIELAYWTHWLSCWAKRHEIENRAGSRDRCYRIKTRAIVSMLNALDRIELEQGKARKVRHLRPPWLTWQPGHDPLERGVRNEGRKTRDPKNKKGLHLDETLAWEVVESLCPIHHHSWIEEGWFEPLDFLDASLDELQGCDACRPAIRDYRNRNGLYHLDVLGGLAELGFSSDELKSHHIQPGEDVDEDVDMDFHLPYAKGRAAGLPDPEQLRGCARHLRGHLHTANGHSGKSGSRFRFGRPITDEEARLHPERAVIREAERLLDAIEAS